jgi:uncharacterized membrane protein YidH (DUF202 family)
VSPPGDTGADYGLVRARTQLAWTRTAISFAAVGSVILKIHLYLGIPVIAFSALIWHLGRLAGTPAAGRRRARQLLVIAVAVVGLSFAALAVTLIGQPSSGLRP